MAESPISKLSNQYHEWVRVHPRAARDFRDAIEDLLNDAGVIFDRVAARVKTWPSLKAKAKSAMLTAMWSTHTHGTISTTSWACASMSFTPR